MLQINPKLETENIIEFIKNTLAKQGFKNLVIGVSGGVDSAVAHHLACQAIGKNNIFAYFLPYKNQSLPNFNTINLKVIDIAEIVEKILMSLRGVKRRSNPDEIPINRDDKLTTANIIARVRMIVLFAKAQKHRALVLGTENRSENLLGYFTRFGDAASDIEPISHLYKTQVYQLAKYLKIPQSIINAKPTAGLWPNQTDEAEFGFSYKLADEILYRYFDKKEQLADLEKEFGKKTVEKVLKRVKNNLFKQFVPYRLQPVFSKA